MSYAGHTPPPGGHNYPPPPQSQQQHYPPPPSHSPPSDAYSYPPPPSFPPPPQQTTYQSEAPTAAQAHADYSRPPDPDGNVGSTYHHQHAGSLSSHPTHGAPSYGSASGYPSAAEEKAQLARMQQLSLQDGGALDDTAPGALDAGAPGQSHFVGAGATVDDVGTFNGGSYRISHRDTNTLLTVQLAMGCPLQAKPGAMIAMSPTITLKGAVKFSMKKLIAGGEMRDSTFTGPGELLLAPAALGDVTMLHLDGTEKNPWQVGKDAFLASTQGINKDYKSQGFGKAMFSGEGLFIYRMSGSGIVWVTSLGAIIRKDLAEGEKYIIDNGHLVAWNCNYVMERAASGGIISNISGGEGLVCKFSGPGTVFMQTRNPTAFAAWLGAHAASNP
ncbi:MAG: hypothetical protein Q9162_004595 [Coniocarpon cinnabarinum]